MEETVSPCKFRQQSLTLLLVFALQRASFWFCWCMCDEPCDSVIMTHNHCCQSSLILAAVWLRRDCVVPRDVSAEFSVARFRGENLKRAQCPTSCRLDMTFIRQKSTLTRSPCVWNTKEDTCEGICERWASGLTTEPCSSELQCRLTHSTGLQLSADGLKSSHLCSGSDKQ